MRRFVVIQRSERERGAGLLPYYLCFALIVHVSCVMSSNDNLNRCAFIIAEFLTMISN
jgi:hypothetical protein